MANSVIKTITPTIKNITKTSLVTQGSIDYIQIGKLVLVQICDFSCATKTHGAVLANGLPPRNDYIPFCVLNTTGAGASSVGWRVALSSTGQLVNHYPSPSSITQASGNFWYIAR